MPSATAHTHASTAQHIRACAVAMHGRRWRKHRRVPSCSLKIYNTRHNRPSAKQQVRTLPPGNSYRPRKLTLPSTRLDRSTCSTVAAEEHPHGRTGGEAGKIGPAHGSAAGRWAREARLPCARRDLAAARTTMGICMGSWALHAAAADVHNNRVIPGRAGLSGRHRRYPCSSRLPAARLTLPHLILAIDQCRRHHKHVVHICGDAGRPHWRSCLLPLPLLALPLLPLPPPPLLAALLAIKAAAV